MIFEKIKVVFKFFNRNNKRKKISAFCNIEIDYKTVRFISRKLLDIRKKGKENKIFKNQEIPVFTEDNLNEILDIANDLHISYPYLMDISFEFENVEYIGFQSNWAFAGPGSTDLILGVKNIELILVKKKANAWKPAKVLEDIAVLFQK